MFYISCALMQVNPIWIMSNQAEIKQMRDAELTQAIEKIVSKRKYQGDRIVFKNSEEFRKAGIEILEKYNATDAERKWFLDLV